MEYKEKKISIKYNLSWTLLGNLTLAGSQFLTLMILAKLGSPKVVGQFTLALAICSPIFLFLSFKLRSVQATDSKDEFNFSNYYSLRIFSNLIAMIIISSIIILSTYELEVKLVVLLMSVIKLLDAQSDIFYGLFQKYEKMDVIAKSLILKSIFNVLLLTAIYYVTQSLLYALGGLLLANLLVILSVDRPNLKLLIGNKKVTVSYNLDVKKLFMLSLPLGLSTVLGSLNTNIPRYFLETKFGSYELGIFAGITYLLVIFSTIVNAIAQVFTPRLSRLFANGEYKNFKRMVLKLNILGAGLGIGGVIITYILGEGLLTIIYTKDYAKYKDILLIVMIGAMFLYSSVFFGTAITAMRKYRVQFPIHIYSFIIILLGSAILISKYNIRGAAWTVALGNLSTTLGYIIIYFLSVSTNLPKKTSIKANNQAKG